MALPRLRSVGAFAMRYLTDDWKSDLHKLAMGGAWSFLAGSAIALLWLIVTTGGSGHGFVLGSAANSQIHAAPLLSYNGLVGTAWIWTQLLAVIAAAGLTHMPWPRQRAIGHAMLVGWAGLWTLGALRLAAI